MDVTRLDTALPLTRQRTLQLYQGTGALMPAARPARTRPIARLTDHLDEFDGLILDGYGVINIGAELVPGIARFLEAVAKRGLALAVLTNGASFPASRAAEKYEKWGLPIASEAVISSRDALIRQLYARPPGQAILTLDRASQPLDPPASAGFTELRADAGAGLAAQLDQADAVVMLGAISWSEEEFDLLAAAMRARPRPFWVANPDVSAPQPDGFSTEPGYWAIRLMQEAGIQPDFIGKPHAPAFELGFEAVQKQAGRALDRRRVAMVGDSLHTDILGGSAFGLQTVLLSGYGLLAGLDAEQIIAETGIAPDWLAAEL
jgi:glycerol 3-phosphatase-2